MKSRSKTREVLLVLVPSLSILGVAFYWTRVEAVSAPGQSQMFISHVEIKTAKGSSVAEGISHSLVVTIDHPWPRPKWWGQGQTINNEVDALTTPNEMPTSMRFRGERPGQFLRVASGGAITWPANGQRQRFKPKKTSWSAANLVAYGDWSNEGSFVFRHSLPLQDVPTSAEPLTFHGLYFLEGQPPLRLKHVLKKRGEQLQWNRSRYTGGKIESLQATAFKAMLWSNTAHEDHSDITITVSHPAPKGSEAPRVFETDLEIVDAQGHVFKPDQRNITIAYGAVNRQNSVTTTQRAFILNIKRAYTLPEPLTLRGKILIDDNWPIPFSLKLPPR